jgi:hypothetical protein
MLPDFKWISFLIAVFISILFSELKYFGKKSSFDDTDFGFTPFESSVFSLLEQEKTKNKDKNKDVVFMIFRV